MPAMNIIGQTFTACAGQTTNLYLSSPGVISYTWNTGSQSSSITVSPTLTTIYTATGTAANGCLSYTAKTLTILALPQLTLSATSSTLCLGNSTSLIVTGQAGNSYSWSTGSSASSVQVSPSLTTTYSVTATASNGCSNTLANTVTVFPLPVAQIIASPPSLCVGQSANLGIIGGNIFSILWTTGSGSSSITVSPTVSTAYSASITSLDGCKSIESSTISVNMLPQAHIISSSDSICEGNTATLSLTGSALVGYQWSGNQTSPSIVVSPSATTIYSVTFTNANTCASSATFQLIVTACTSTVIDTGVESLSFEQKKLLIFPNPNEGSFEIRGYGNEKISMFNNLGQLILEFSLSAENNYTWKISNLAKGVYSVRSYYSAEKIIVK